MEFPAICFSHTYLLIMDISGKSEETVQYGIKYNYDFPLIEKVILKIFLEVIYHSI